MTYYLKYRSQKVRDLDILEVRESLLQIVKAKKIPHAFLFAGPKGTGKTSAARILAKVFNCLKLTKDNEPCNTCEQCQSIIKGNNLDVVELDAASHRGVDDIRALRDAVKLTPFKAKKKVYIIDEAHMLTTEASNALLKTLEEPPDHVLFILATTNPEKLIETVRSRTVYIPFRKAKDEEIVSSLERIVEGEKLKVDKKTLMVIARASDGSFRDAAKVMEQLVTEKVSLTETAVEAYLFKHKDLNLKVFLDLLINRKTTEAIKEIENCTTKGVGMEIFLTNLLSILRQALLAKVGLGDDNFTDLTKEKLIDLIESLSLAQSQIKTSLIEQLPVEMAVIKWCEEEKSESHEEQLEKKPSLDQKEVKEDKAALSEKPVMTIDADCLSLETWRMILSKVRLLNTSVEALLRSTRPLALEGSTLILGVYYKFHKEKLEENRNRQLFENAVSEVVGKPIKVSCQLTQQLDKAPEREAKEIKPALTEGGDNDIIKAAEEIFS